MSQRIVGCGDALIAKGYFAVVDTFKASADTFGYLTACWRSVSGDASL
jgi:hypothetical protein